MGWGGVKLSVVAVEATLMVFETSGHLFMPDDAQRVELQLSLQQHPGADIAFDFSIAALSDSTGHWHTHVTGL